MITHKWKDIKSKMSPRQRHRVEQKAKEMLVDIEIKETFALLKSAKKKLRTLAKALPNDDNYAYVYSLIRDTEKEIDKCFDKDTGIVPSLKMARDDAKKDQNPMPNGAKGWYPK